MASPFTYRELGELMGSWPFSVLKDPSPAQQLQPNSLQTKATLVSTRREPSTGYNIGGLSLTIYVDVAGVPTAHTVTFPGGTGLGSGGPNYFTLAQVIARFQASTPVLPVNTAQNSDKFLLLQSQTVGEDSYVRLESILGAEGVFRELGLQTGVIAKGGDLKPAQHIDPSRQVAGYNQIAMQHGENFSADVVNRITMQLAINAAQSRGTTDLRRLAVRTEQSFVGSGLAGVQLSVGDPEKQIYTGAVASPSVDQLRQFIVVLDTSGNEFTKEMESAGSTFADLNFTFDAPSGEQRVSSASITFLSTDPDGNWYVIATNLTGGPSVLNNRPLKIIRFISATSVVIDTVDPATGTRHQITEASRSGRRSQIFNVKCEVEGFYSDAGFTTPIEQVQVAVSGGGGAVTEVEGPNRIFVNGANFSTATKPGDLVEWTGSGATSPYSNNGTYRVSRVLDAKRIELVDENYNPVILNPSIGVGLGSVAVSTDGDFFRQPYVKFMPATLGNFQVGTGALPNGENYRIVYLEGRSLREAIDANPAIIAPDLRTEIDGTGALQNAILRLVGPSVTKFDEVLYSKEMLNFDFLGREHHPASGRHSTVHPDVIDLYPGVAGTTATFRVSAIIDAPTLAKVRLVDDFDTFNKFGINRLGQVGIGDSIATFGIWPELNTPWTGLDRFADIFVNRDTTERAYALFRGVSALNVLSALSPSSPSIATDTIGITTQRFYFDDGVIAQPHIHGIGMRSSTVAGESFLSLGDVANDGAGNSFYNNLLVYANGNVGVGFDNSIVGTTIPEVPLHIAARTTSTVDLLRLEGFIGGTGDPTVAMTWKPKRTLPYFAFIEVDHDSPGAAGDWSMNFVLTQDAEDDSDGFFNRARFRFVARAGGTPIEMLAIDPAIGIDFRSAGMGIQFASTSTAGIFFSSGASGSIQHDGTGNVSFLSSGTVTFGVDLTMFECYPTARLRGGIDELGASVLNSVPVIDWDAAMSTSSVDHHLERMEVASGFLGPAQHWDRFASDGMVIVTRGVNHNFTGRWSANNAIFTVQSEGLFETPLVVEYTSGGINFYGRPIAAPATFGKSNMQLDIQLQKRSPLLADNAGAKILVRNGILQFNGSVAGEPDGTNLDRDDPPLANALYGMNIVKCWGHIYTNGIGGVFVDAEAGFNIESVTIVAGTTIEINFETDLAVAFSFTDYCVVCCMTNGGGFPYWGFVVLSSKGPSSFRLDAIRSGGAGADVLLDPDTDNFNLEFIVMGRQTS